MSDVRLERTILFAWDLFSLSGRASSSLPAFVSDIDLIFSSFCTREGFFPRRPSGQAVIMGVVPTPSGRCLYVFGSEG